MSIVSKACHKAFNADKMNIELLCNGDAHIHFHLFPKVNGHMPVKGPVWWTPVEEMYNDIYKVSDDNLSELKLKKELFRLLDN